MPSALTCQQFLELVWPDQGPYCLAWPLKDKFKSAQDGYAHRAYDTIAEAVNAAMTFCFTEQVNVYFATHALKVGWVDIVKKDGKPGRKVSRTHDNMREGRTFFFDLDVGDGDFKYSSREQALATLQRFLFSTGLPTPLVVNSGGGYHAYFLLDEPIASDVWRGFADRMRWLATQHKLLVDPSRTTDQSSVLRVVGTKNLKPAIMAKVQALNHGEVSDTADFTSYLISITEDYTPLATLVRSSQKVVGNLGTSFDGRVTPPDEVFAVCEQMRMFRDNMGVISEPHWFVAIGTMRWADEGVALCHTLSSGDPRYSEAETQGKIDHWSDKSAPSCAKIELECGNDVCNQCPLKGKGKNPLDIANREWALKAAPKSKQTATQLALGIVPLAEPCPAPYPYAVSNGGISKVVYDAEQKADVQKIVLPYRFFPIAKFKGTKLETGHSDWAVDIPLEGQQTFTFQDDWFHNSQDFATNIMSNGIILPSGPQLNEAKTYMLHYLKTLQSTSISTKVHDHFGWDYADSKQSQKTAFVLNKRAFDLASNEFKPAAMANSMKSFNHIVQADGDHAAYMDALDFFNRPQYRHLQFVIAAGFVVPFFYATGHHGMIISATGRSGASKTTSLAAIAGQWGPPEQYMINASPTGMSANARVDRFQAFPNLPVCLDELTNQSSEAINELALSISQPLGKITLKQDRTVREHRSGVRHSIAFCSTNTSLITLINATNAAGEAAIARVIEVDCAKGPTAEKVSADRIIRALQANYGFGGPMMLEALLPHRHVIEEEITAMSDKLSGLWKLQAVERFTGGCMATLYVVGRRLYDLGLLRFDVDEIGEWFESVQLPKQRQIMDTQGQKSNPIEVLSSFIMQRYAEGIRIDEDGSGNIGAHISVPLTRSLAFRFDIHTKQIWIRSQAFNEFCVQQKLDYGTIVGTLKRWSVIIDYDRRNLLSGVPNTPVTRAACYIIDMEHPRIAGVVAQAQPKT